MTKLEILKKYFGYDSFREGQEQLIDALLTGRDVLGVMPTGAGKSLCYQVPALMLPGITLVISPLISLMKDQVQALNQAGIHAAYINSSLSESQISRALLLAAEGRYKIIYAAPERLETQNFQWFASRADISMVSVDEAHCISQWGQDFRPSYLRIVSFVQGLSRRPVIGAFTATATEIVKEDISCTLGLRDPLVLVTGFDRRNLFFSVQTPGSKDAFVLDYVRRHPGESGIIYCATRKNTEKVYEKLREAGIAATRYHAGLGSMERTANQEDFIYDRCPVMAATNAFGMGIDKSNVRYVIHYNMPQSMENYYQEAGRAGRDGERSECILLYSAQDVIINRFLLENKEENPNLDPQQQEAVRERDEARLSLMEKYCQTRNCLREYILHYFGEQTAGRCENCGNCLQEFEEKDATEEARLVIRCIRELRRGYGTNVVAGTLAGAARAKLREYKVTELASYGSLKQWSEPQIRDLIRAMISENYLEASKDRYALLRVTEAGIRLEAGEGKMILRLPKAAGNEAAVRSGGSQKVRRSDILNSEGLTLFDRLRALRFALASAEEIPPYLVFSDRTLTDMCVRLPGDREGMLAVSGVGEFKYEKYGPQFLEEIRKFTGGAAKKLYFGEPGEAASAIGGGVRKKKVKEEFSVTEAQAQAFPYEEEGILITQLAEKLNELRNPDEMKKTSGAELFRWVMSEGLAYEHRVEGMYRKAVTEKGMEAGLVLAPRTGRSGMEYMDIYYDRKAQEMLVWHCVKKQGPQNSGTGES